MKKTYEYIMFDWDGTLSHSLPAWFEAHRITLLEKYNISLSDEDLIDKMLVQPKGLLEFNINHDEYFTYILEYVENNFQKIRIHNDVIETLEVLKSQNKKLAIVTSQWKRFVESTLHFLKFHHYFDFIVAGDDVVNFKPHPEPIEKALEQFKAHKNQAIMIGDSDADICAARNAGIDSVWFHPEENLDYYPHGHFDHLKPTYTIRSMKALLEIV